MALFEKFWDCPACGTTGISALRKQKCPNCGHSKTSQDVEHRSGVEITDPEGIELARGGPHWVCSNCGSVSLNKFDVCESCGNPKEESDHKNEVRELGTTPPPDYNPQDTTQQWYQPAGNESERESSDAVYHSPLTQQEPEYLTIKPSFKNNFMSLLASVSWPHILLGLLITLVLIGLGWVLFRTTTVKAEVVGYSWVREVQIDLYRTVHESGWSSPFGAYNVSTSSKIHHYDPIYETRTETVHHSKTCYKDLGNGAEESFDCSYDTTEPKQVKVGDKPVYDTWYEYDIDKWVYYRTVHAEGSDRNPYWPTYELKFNGQTIVGAERVGSMPETYVVYFRSMNVKAPKDYRYNTTQAQWMKYANEVEYTLKINSLNAIVNNPLEDYLKVDK